MIRENIGRMRREIETKDERWRRGQGRMMERDGKWHFGQMMRDCHDITEIWRERERGFWDGDGSVFRKIIISRMHDLDIGSCVACITD